MLSFYINTRFSSCYLLFVFLLLSYSGWLWILGFIEKIKTGQSRRVTSALNPYHGGAVYFWYILPWSLNHGLTLHLCFMEWWKVGRCGYQSLNQYYGYTFCMLGSTPYLYQLEIRLDYEKDWEGLTACCAFAALPRSSESVLAHLRF